MIEIAKQVNEMVCRYCGKIRGNDYFCTYCNAPKETNTNENTEVLAVISKQLETEVRMMRSLYFRYNKVR